MHQTPFQYNVKLRTCRIVGLWTFLFLCVQSVTWILTTAIPGMIGSFRIGNFFSRYYLLKRLTLSENCFH